MSDSQATIDTREAPTGFTGLLRNIGPGVVVSGSVVGSGELLVTTRMGAEVGFVFLWGVIIASLVKFFIQLELGRQCILYDDTTIDTLDRMPGPRWGGSSWLAWICVAGYFSVFLALIGILGSVAGLAHSVAPFLGYQPWALVVFLLMSVLLWRGLYEDLEKMVTILVTAFSVIVIGSLLVLQGTGYAISGADLVSGFGFTLPSDGAFVALAVMGSVGATGVELFMYPYWVREKGYPRFVGADDGSDAWRDRYRGWMRVLMMDAGVCTLIALAITCAYYLLGASVLARLNVIPQGPAVVEQVSLIFTETLGPAWKGLFMLGAFCTLFSTLLVFAASSGRIGADFLQRLRFSRAQGDEGRRQVGRALQIAFPLFWLLVIVVKSDAPFFLVLLGANANNLLLIPMAYSVLHLAMREVEGRRMSLGGEIGLMLTIWVIINFTAVNLYLTWTG
ncbi:MAG: Nramp family divalent metal transporter [Gemmatimonadetes bacterium]|jgi:manganese transport protein|nr:Nramp family divalent metal transporter [Gemmatimonadota bacterium]MBT6149599.1 Nramp family divalent metal transporter [Gemmatimonadota bacterium]MBT7861659.1 Nramp family divalent metal transporter [Gemmatimonadota bacterium]